MKILYIAPMPPEETGVADYASDFIDMLASRGHTVDLFKGYKGKTGRINSYVEYLEAKRHVRSLAPDIEKSGYDLIYAEFAHNAQFEYWYLYHLKRTLPSLRYGFTVHDPPVLVTGFKKLPLMADGKLSRYLSRTLDFFNYRNIFFRFIIRDAFINILTKRGRDVFERGCYDRRKAYYLPHVVNLADNREKGKRPARNIYFFGYWGPRKGIDLLIDAFDVIADRYKDSRLYIGGAASKIFVKSNYVNHIHQRIGRLRHRDRVTLLGFLKKDELRMHYERADIVVLPYLDYGNTVPASAIAMNAIASGCILAASRVNAFDEYVIDGKNGYLFNAGSAEDIREALEKILSEPIFPQKAYDFNMQFASYFSPDAAGRIFEDNFADFVKAHEYK